MRVTMTSGDKRVVVMGRSRPAYVVLRNKRGGGASEKLDFTVIRPTGQVERGRLHLDLGPVKKDAKILRPIERGIRKMIRAEYKALGRYLVLHDESRRKRRNGWVKDLGGNVMEVMRRKN